MNHSRDRLENPIRLAELNPKARLEQIGLHSGDVFCDIGAGSGIFTFAAAEITKADVYAVEVSEEMRTILRTEVKNLGVANIMVVDNIARVPSDLCDVVLLCAVFHELPDPQGMMEAVKRVLSNKGLLSIIEFHKRSTPMGPPVSLRIGSEDLRDTMQRFGFDQKDNFILGDNYYCSMFSLSDKKETI